MDKLLKKLNVMICQNMTDSLRERRYGIRAIKRDDAANLLDIKELYVHQKQLIEAELPVTLTTKLCEYIKTL